MFPSQEQEHFCFQFQFPTLYMNIAMAQMFMDIFYLFIFLLFWIWRLTKIYWWILFMFFEIHNFVTINYLHHVPPKHLRADPWSKTTSSLAFCQNNPTQTSKISIFHHVNSRFNSSRKIRYNCPKMRRICLSDAFSPPFSRSRSPLAPPPG